MILKGTKIEIRGLNLERLINIIHKEGIKILKFKRIEYNLAELDINSIDDSKIFAILEKLCYNYKIVKKYGFLTACCFFKNRIGLAIGLVIFLVMSIFSSTLIFDIKLLGTGNMYEDEIIQVLKENGITKYTVQNRVNFRDIERRVLESNKEFIFVSIEKKGNKLIVNVEKTKETTQILEKTNK